MRFTVKILLIIAALVMLAELFFVFRPEPDILTAGVALGEAPIADVLRAQFPIGSPARVLEEELNREGQWGSIHIDRVGETERFWHYVQYRRRVGLGLFTPEVTKIGWEVDHDGPLNQRKRNQIHRYPGAVTIKTEGDHKGRPLWAPCTIDKSPTAIRRGKYAMRAIAAISVAIGGVADGEKAPPDNKQDRIVTDQSALAEYPRPPENHRRAAGALQEPPVAIWALPPR